MCFERPRVQQIDRFTIAKCTIMKIIKPVNVVKKQKDWTEAKKRYFQPESENVDICEIAPIACVRYGA